jgi:hypothetical protein
MRLLVPGVIAVGALLAGCADTTGGYGYGPYAEAYGSPVYPYGGPYGGPAIATPGYIAPYAYPPTVVTPYRGGVWAGRDYPGRHWNSHPPRPPDRPPPTAWHHPPPQVAPRPPPVAAPPPAVEAQRNRQLLDQMGFRANR